MAGLQTQLSEYLKVNELIRRKRPGKCVFQLLRGFDKQRSLGLVRFQADGDAEFHESSSTHSEFCQRGGCRSRPFGLWLYSRRDATVGPDNPSEPDRGISFDESNLHQESGTISAKFN